jgi:hypothetical protein
VGSSHTVGITSPQVSGGTRWVFANWNDGVTTPGRTITTPASTTTYTANFTTQYLFTPILSPSAGGTIIANPASTDGFYTSPTPVTLTAAANPGYGFASWSGDLTGTTNPQTITMSAARTVTASFSLLPVSITVTTNPVGRSFTVDGTPYATSQTFSWASGSSHTIATSSPQTVGGTRYLFSNWSDGGAISHSILTPSGSATYTANFTMQYLLTTAAAPQAGGTVGASPPSADGFYNDRASVQLSAVPNGSYVFTNWTGDLTGTTSPRSVSAAKPMSSACSSTRGRI